ncbi:hypothetical protein AYO38_06620 [bacterium SCGC AG-212-C10]|nr:hypothetical protein AYO38_06620 [bacterium SCGC AG-212-C10]
MRDTSGTTARTELLVIGSGFGGLTAAALAAATDIETCVVEQHLRPGGCAGDFALEGFWFPAGATVVTGLEPGGILRRVFDAAAIPVAAHELDPSIVVHAGGLSVAYSAGVHRWADAVERAFPGVPPGYRRFWEWSHRAGGDMYTVGRALPAFPIERLSDVRRSAHAISPAALRAAPLLFRTAGRVKRKFGAAGHAAADAIIDGMLLDSTGASAEQCSAAQAAIALDLYRRGCQWVEGGTGRLAMDLVRSIRRNGGEVRFRARVVSLERCPGGWQANLSDGSAIRARRVMANLPPGALRGLLGGDRTVPAAREAWSAFVLHLGIDGRGLEEIHPFHQVVEPSRPLHDGGNAFVSIYRGKGERSGRWSISVSTHTRPGSWRESDYAPGSARRTQLEEALIGAVERVIPCVRSRIVVRRSATPRSFERFTLRPDGFVGGLVQRPSNGAQFAAGHRPAPGIYLAGDHVFPGQGTVGVALSGINAYRDVCDSLKKRALL